MLKVGTSVRVASHTLQRRNLKRGSAIGRARGKVISLESPHGERWVEVKWSGKMLTHKYSNIHQIEVVK